MMRVVTAYGLLGRVFEALEFGKHIVGPDESGSKWIWKEALAGQISVTPLIRLSRTALVIDRDLKKASSDISSSPSTKM